MGMRAYLRFRSIDFREWLRRLNHNPRQRKPFGPKPQDKVLPAL
jgi:hypothetical protein